MSETSTVHSGLTSAEVAARVAAGQTNAVEQRTSRPVTDIVRANVFTWFNLILGVLWALMVTFGSWQDALFGFVLVFNTAIGVAQEVRAKVTLDRLSLISAPKARVIRDGVAGEVAIDEVVLDDTVVLSPGDQIVVDASVLASEGLEVDESALTGESVPVVKAVGDSVMSGSFVVAGRGLLRATAVGANSYAMRIEAEGRRFVRVRSDVIDGINTILRWIGLALVPVGILTILSSGRAVDDIEARVTNTVAALVSMVPEGLVLLSSIAFALSAIALARHRVLVNELAAVEGLARADVVLTDKTGTLTEHEPTFGSFRPLRESGIPEVTALQALGALAGADPTPNATIRAIARGTAIPEGWAVVASVPFSSTRKWSGVVFEGRGMWVLGAPDVVLEGAPGWRPDVIAARSMLADLVAEGSRVLLVAHSEAPLGSDGVGGRQLPEDLKPVGFVLLVERLRPDAADTVRYLGEEGVALKIISGDNAYTVSQIAAAAGIPGAERAVDARTLSEPGTLATAVEGATVFGRVMPEQKSAMVAALQGAGHTVAMTGDGVNDVLALKQADLGIAMGAGVPAARAVAEVVLLDNRFATLPLIMAEGRRVVANAERVANLFLTKSVWAMLLAVVVGVLGIPYPFLPRHVTLAGSLAIGIPAFFFALGPNLRRYRPGLVSRVLRFAVPAGVVIGATVLATFLVARAGGMSLEHARTLTTLVLIVVSLAVIVILEWPLAGYRLAVVAAMAGGLVIVFAWPFARGFFALVVPTAGELVAALGVSAAAAVAIALLTRDARRSARG